MRLIPVFGQRKGRRMEEKELLLQPRLRLLAELVQDGARLADVGTDHGYLPVWLLLNGKISGAIASDINEAPLSHARCTAETYRVAEKISFRLCAGLDGIGRDEVDTVVIAGMGGETIQAILTAAPWTLESDITLLLQPMTKAPELRRWLTESGYCIVRERLVWDKSFLYPVLIVRPGRQSIREAERYCGVNNEEDPLYGEYLARQCARLQRACRGMHSARRGDNTERTAALERLCEELERKREEWENGKRSGN